MILRQKRNPLVYLIVFCVSAGFAALSQASPAAGAERPKLILQITVDQLRGDMPYRYLERLSPDGFRYLLRHGTVFKDAHHRHANTETIVGHATLATGADPAAHGMVANVWYDREAGELVYNIEDKRYPLLSTREEEKKDAEIDPTQKIARSKGRSPAAILASTFSDELAVHFGGRPKIFGVSVKDRGAVSMAGHAGKAFWFSKEDGDFITSTFYYKEYPSWVKAWNKKRLSDQWSGKSWELMNEKSSYLFAAMDDRPYETDFPGYGRTFPHAFGTVENKYFYTLLTVSPVGDELTADFAKALIENEQLGRDDIPDYLSISFSSTDYVGHLFGPSSLESEDNILRLDATLADLLRFVDDQIGLKNTLIVLSADHGAPEAPEYMAGLGMEAERIDPKSVDKEPTVERLKKQFGIGKELIAAYFHPYFYLDRDVIRDKGLDQAEVERAIASELMTFEGVALAVSSSDIRNGRIPQAPVIQQIRRNFHPKRSGDIYVVQKPYWHLYEEESIRLTAIHGSPWRYDTYVPIIFAGASVPARSVSRRVHTVDIAPTLSACLGVKPPSGSVGKPLAEVLDRIDPVAMMTTLSEKPMKKDIEIIQSWKGDYPVDRLSLLPADQQLERVGYVGEAVLFADLWRAFKPAEKVPEVDFNNHIVVFSRNVDFYNRTSIGKVTLENGVAEVLAMETLSAIPIEDKVAMALAVIPRDGVKFIGSGEKRIPVRTR